MKHYVVMPDSFKGSLSSLEVCEQIKTSILSIDPSAKVTAIPIADGGEGTVQSFLAAFGGEPVLASVSGPFLEPKEATYALLPDGTAVIEMAACAGLPLVGEHQLPHIATTYGVGELILHALKKGAQKIILGLGGSATNDGGCGMAAALGVRFYKKDKTPFIPTGETLCQIDCMDTTALTPHIKDIPILAMCDVDNPLYGPQGAAYVFGPQKGASGPLLALLDDGLRHLSTKIKEHLHLDVTTIKGAGAAGGMGAGAVAFLQATLTPGIDILLQLLHAEELFKEADILFTGEGRFDSQSLHGKAIIGIAKRAKDYKVPVLVLAGSVHGDITPAYDLGVTAAFSIHPEWIDLETAIKQTPTHLHQTVTNLVRLLQSSAI